MDNFASLNQIFADTPVSTKELEKKKEGPTINEGNLSVTIDGKVYKFPTLDALNQYKKAAGL